MTNDPTSRIRYLKDVQKLSFRQIAEELGISRHKVSSQYSGIYCQKSIRGFLLDPYRDLIVGWFRETPSLKSVQVWQRLKERGVAVHENTVANYTFAFRKKKKGKVHWPLSFLPGEEAQVDWFFMNHNLLGKLCGFTFILSYSRFAFAHLFHRHSFEFFIDGHLKAFEAIGGVPMTLRYDNLKSVVIKRQPLTYNQSFLEFARFYDFDIRLCNPASGNEKGRVERLIRSIRETFENTAGHHKSLTSLNKSLHDWIEEKNSTIHRATNKRPLDQKTEEKLKPLPQNPYSNRVIQLPKRPTKTGLIIFDTNSYSIPDYLIRQSVSVHAGVDTVDFYDAKGKKIASHPRCFERYQTIINPQHRSIKNLSSEAKRERIYTVIKNMDKDMEIFLNQNSTVGEDAYQTALALFRLLKTTSRKTLLSLIREAIKMKSPRMKYIVSALQLEPETPAEMVSPQKQELLLLDYQQRTLEEYEDETENK
jgi:hypothetical protein